MRTPAVIIVVAILTIGTGTVYWLDVVHQKSGISDASYLAIGIRLNATTIYPGQHVSFSYWVNNTSTEGNNVTAQDRWAFSGLDVSKAIFTPLSNPAFNCSVFARMVITSVSFRPLSDKANLSYHISQPASLSVSLDGEESIPGAIYPSQLTSGQYTIVVGDEWGQVVIGHFLVANQG